MTTKDHHRTLLDDALEKRDFVMSAKLVEKGARETSFTDKDVK